MIQVQTRMIVDSRAIEVKIASLSPTKYVVRLLMNRAKQLAAQLLATPMLNFRRGSFKYENSMKRFISYLKDQGDSEKFKKEVVLYDQVLTDSDRGQKPLFHYLRGYKSFIKLNGTQHMTFTDFSILKRQESSSK